MTKDPVRPDASLSMPSDAELEEMKAILNVDDESHIHSFNVPTKEFPITKEYLSSLPREQKIYILRLKTIRKINERIAYIEKFNVEYESKVNEIRKRLDSDAELKKDLDLFKETYFNELKKIGYDEYQACKTELVDIKAEKDSCTLELWSIIERYGIQRINIHLKSYQSFAHSDSFDDLYADVHAKFMRTLMDYNPIYYKPTTYFHFYFDEVITEYIRKNLTHLTQNDSKNIRDIKAAINYFVDLGVEPDDEMIATYLNKSVKTVKKFRNMAANSGYVDIDEQINLASNSETPAQQYEREEFESTFLKAIKESLTEQEQQLVWIKYYVPDRFYNKGKKDPSDIDPENSVGSLIGNNKYKKKFPALANKRVAEVMGLTVREVNNMSNLINQKLRNNKDILNIINHKEKEVNQLEFQDNSADILSTQIMGVDLSALSFKNVV